MAFASLFIFSVGNLVFYAVSIVTNRFGTKPARHGNRIFGLYTWANVGFNNLNRSTGDLLGLNPIYLLNEHLLMSKGLFLFTLLTVTVFVIWLTQTAVRLSDGVVLGLLLSFCILTRANGVLFCLTFVAGLALFHYFPKLTQLGRRKRRDIVLFWLAFTITTSILVGSWAWRNYNENGQLTPFAASVNRNRLIYLVQHDLVEPTLPLFETVAQTADLHNPFDIMRTVHYLDAEPQMAEALAGKLLREQIRTRPWRYVETAVVAGFRFAGWESCQPIPVGSNDVHFWFKSIVADVPFLDQINQACAFDPQRISFHYISLNQNTPLTRMLSIRGQRYFEFVRPILFSLALFVLFWKIIQRRHNFKKPWPKMLILFGIAYGLTGLFHAIMLADYDRFAVPFDWILVCFITIDS